MSRWSRFRALSWGERGALLEAVVLLAAAPLLVRWTRFRRGGPIGEGLRGDGSDAGEHGPHLAAARAIARLAAAAASLPLVRPGCLEHSLALWLMLRRRAIDCDLRLGVRQTDGRCEAHAWVEAYGVPLSDPDRPRERFAAFDVALVPVRGGSFASSGGSGTLPSISRDIASAVTARHGDGPHATRS